MICQDVDVHHLGRVGALVLPNSNFAHALRIAIVNASKCTTASPLDIQGVSEQNELTPRIIYNFSIEGE